MYCSFTNFRCVKNSLVSDRAEFGFVFMSVSVDDAGSLHVLSFRPPKIPKMKLHSNTEKLWNYSTWHRIHCTKMLVFWSSWMFVYKIYLRTRISMITVEENLIISELERQGQYLCSRNFLPHNSTQPRRDSWITSRESCDNHCNLLLCPRAAKACFSETDWTGKKSIFFSFGDRDKGMDSIVLILILEKWELQSFRIPNCLILSSSSLTIKAGSTKPNLTQRRSLP